jgi:hypothetical protein
MNISELRDLNDLVEEIDIATKEIELEFSNPIRGK